MPANIVQQILDSVSDEDLKLAMSEIKVLNTTGVLSPGVIRRVAADLNASTRMAMGDALSFVQRKLSERAAFYWAGI